MKVFFSLYITLFSLSAMALESELIKWADQKTHPKIYQEAEYSLKNKTQYKVKLDKFILNINIESKNFQVKTIGPYRIFHDQKNIHPTVILNPLGKSNYIIEAPHAGFETSTHKQAIIMLESLDAKAAIISGAHRCASEVNSPCDGKTGVCGNGKRAYPLSDSAHSLDNYFQLAHEFLADFFKESKIIQLHEMRKSDSPIKIILSSTANSINNNPDSFVLKTRNRLRMLHNNELVAVSCNDQNDLNLNFRRLCGFTNIQGRYLNNSSNICGKFTNIDNNRFIHIEQDFATTLEEPYISHLIKAFSE